MHSVEDCCAQLMEQLKCLKEKWCATCVENVKLYKKIFELRKALNPGERCQQLASPHLSSNCYGCGSCTCKVKDAMCERGGQIRCLQNVVC